MLGQEANMAHPLRSNVRYVQKVLEQETGVKVSYNWILQEVSRHMDEAVKISEFEHKPVKEVLVWLIRPRDKQLTPAAESSVK